LKDLTFVCASERQRAEPSSSSLPFFRPRILAETDRERDEKGRGEEKRGGEEGRREEGRRGGGCYCNQKATGRVVKKASERERERRR
jgi:hypothetical protein